MSASVSLESMSASSTFGFGIDAFGLKICVKSDSAAMRDALNRFLLPPLARCEIARDAADIALEALTSATGYEIAVDGVKVSSAVTLADGALAAVKGLDDALVRKLRGLRAVHAGAVVLHGRALLIPGSSHAGKSSLVAELLRRGAALLSDEYALIDGNGLVHAYPRPLLLRNGRPRQSLALPSDLDARFASEPAKPGWIIAVDYAQGGSWSIDRISQGQGVMLLLSNTPHEMGQSPEMIDLFTRSVGSAECYAGTRGEVGEAADRILELVAQ